MTNPIGTALTVLVALIIVTGCDRGIGPVATSAPTARPVPTHTPSPDDLARERARIAFATDPACLDWRALEETYGADMDAAIEAGNAVTDAVTAAGGIMEITTTERTAIVEATEIQHQAVRKVNAELPTLNAAIAACSAASGVQLLPQIGGLGELPMPPVFVPIPTP